MRLESVDPNQLPSFVGFSESAHAYTHAQRTLAHTVARTDPETERHPCPLPRHTQQVLV